MLSGKRGMANQFYKGLIMLKRLFELCCILFLFVSHAVVTAVPPSKEEELHFISLMDSQLSRIIDDKLELKGK